MRAVTTVRNAEPREPSGTLWRRYPQISSWVRGSRSDDITVIWIEFAPFTKSDLFLWHTESHEGPKTIASLDDRCADPKGHFMELSRDCAGAPFIKRYPSEHAHLRSCNAHTLASKPAITTLLEGAALPLRLLSVHSRCGAPMRSLRGMRARTNWGR
jgi:hypothetical protein